MAQNMLVSVLFLLLASGEGVSLPQRNQEKSAIQSAAVPQEEVQVQAAFTERKEESKWIATEVIGKDGTIRIGKDATGVDLCVYQYVSARYCEKLKMVIQALACEQDVAFSLGQQCIDMGISDFGPDNPPNCEDYPQRLVQRKEGRVIIFGFILLFKILLVHPSPQCPFGIRNSPCFGELRGASLELYEKNKAEAAKRAGSTIDYEQEPELGPGRLGRGPLSNSKSWAPVLLELFRQNFVKVRSCAHLESRKYPGTYKTSAIWAWDSIGEPGKIRSGSFKTLCWGFAINEARMKSEDMLDLRFGDRSKIALVPCEDAQVWNVVSDASGSGSQLRATVASLEFCVQYLAPSSMTEENYLFVSRCTKDHFAWNPRGHVVLLQPDDKYKRCVYADSNVRYGFVLKWKPCYRLRNHGKNGWAGDKLVTFEFAYGQIRSTDDTRKCWHRMSAVKAGEMQSGGLMHSSAFASGLRSRLYLDDCAEAGNTWQYWEHRLGFVDDQYTFCVEYAHPSKIRPSDSHVYISTCTSNVIPTP